MDLRKLIDSLREDGVLKTPDIIRAFEAVDRKDFVPHEYLARAYADEPLSIGFGQTISQPYTVAFMLELLEPKPDQRILDVGSGSGWTTALLASITGERGKVYAVELIPELAEKSRESLKRYHFKNVEVRDADPKRLGFPTEAPFDRILVSAGSAELPQKLVDQLTTGGILVIPVGNALWRVLRTEDGATDIQKFAGFAFVPLIH